MQPKASRPRRGCRAGRLLALGDESGCWKVECFGDVEKALKEQASSSVFDVDQDVPGHARAQCKLFLCQPALDSQLANPATHLLASRLPRRDPLGIVLAGACWHCPISRSAP